MIRLMDTRSGFSVLVLALLLAMGCQSESSEQQETSPSPLPDNEIAIEDPWVRPAPAGSTSALYMTIANGRQNPDTLLEVNAPIIDSSAVLSGDTEMSDGLPVPAQSRTTLAPESTHVRLVNLQQSLDENGSVILNVGFAQSDRQRMQVPVRTSPPSEQQ
jgi:copper(I)-binding protein